MTPDQHYDRADELLDTVKKMHELMQEYDNASPIDRAEVLASTDRMTALAQAHATLATVAPR